jgi:membrane-associated phospholipid phosphatase
MNTLKSSVIHEIQDYPHWLRSLSSKEKLLPFLLSFLYLGGLWAMNGLIQTHFTVVAIMLAIYFGGRFSRTKLFPFLFPFFLTLIIYDSMKFYNDFLRAEIRVKWPYEFDKHFFGINTPEGRLTLNEYFQKHIHPFLDLLTGFYYLTFAFIYLGIAIYWRFILKTTSVLLHLRLSRQAGALVWGFFWLNILGYTTYYWFPAAPPWYVAAHGLAEPPDMSVGPSQAGAVRFDQLLGTHFFSDFYGKSNDVFGAIPSLHVAYPFLALCFSFYFKSLRLFCLWFYLVMCFSALYLNHHYMIDILWGSTYAFIIYLCMIFYPLHNKGNPYGRT